MFGTVAVASILTLAAGCDKRAPEPVEEAKITSLAGKPRVLFLLFGDRSAPRALPIATLAGGKVVPIELDASGWRGFDGLYFPPGGTLTAYRRGQPLANAQIRRGMWGGEDDEPLYKLPSCRALRPLAAVTLDGAVDADVILELFATSDPLPGMAGNVVITSAHTDSARAFAGRAAQREGFTAAARAELDLVVAAIATGATTHPTVTASYLEQGSGVTGASRHLFVIGDWAKPESGYQASFVYLPDSASRDFRRLIDHLDLTGDGVDEVIVEGWRSGSDSYLVFLQFKEGRWREIARGATSWCADRKAG